MAADLIELLHYLNPVVYKLNQQKQELLLISQLLNLDNNNNNSKSRTEVQSSRILCKLDSN
jgi:hypothetical protein